MPQDVHTADLSVQETKLAGFLDNSFFVLQPKKGGHKSGLDAVLVAAMVPSGFSGKVADFGAGNGTAGMAVAQRCPETSIGLIEINPAAFALIQHAFDLPQNAHLADRLNCHLADVTDIRGLKARGLAMGTWEFIISNPPFNDESHRRSPDKDRALAHVLPQDGLEKWISSAAKLLKPGGRLALILRPAGLSEALVALVPQFGAVSIKPVHPKMDQPAGRVLIVATRASKAALTILPGLVLHKADGRFTDEAEEILRGRTGIVL